ncbi:uncharacterized protein LOC111891507 [Lactuca sativa]|uniref:uncharacterized protein LOC111891507 n=1 Tax=Lactuca sativa TaxID=4236 RepID=UPI000CD83CB9|nr:uncharacterized protein LOC111891507 [Lactuca sativa]
MPPQRYNRRKSNSSTPLPRPPFPEMDNVVFQGAVTAVVSQISSSSNRCGNGTNSSNQSENQGHLRECTYKDFVNYKPKPLNGIGGVIALMRWFEKTKSIFEICSYAEESKGNNGWLEESEDEPEEDPEEESEEEPEEDPGEESEGEPEVEVGDGPAEPVVDQEEEEVEGGLEEEPSEDEDGDSDAEAEVISPPYPIRVPAYRVGPTGPTPL